MCTRTLIVLSLLIASPLAADQVKPDLRCGPSISRESVKVLDISELPSSEVEDFIRAQVGGPFNVVRKERVQATSNLGRAWKKAEKQAASLGCPFVVVTSSGREETGLWRMHEVEPSTPLTRDTATVFYLRPTAVSKSAGLPGGGAPSA